MLDVFKVWYYKNAYIHLWIKVASIEFVLDRGFLYLNRKGVITMRKQYTKEEKAEYFEKLRKEWDRSKELAASDKVAEALFRETRLKGISFTGFYFVLKQMKRLRMDGLPHIDCKTFNGWRENGFKVKKNSKSKIQGITWIGIERDEGEVETENEESKYLYPKVYHLFHKSQVEPLK